MIAKIRTLTILMAFILLGIMIYEGFIKNEAHAWKNYQEPQMASYTSLEEDQKILRELDRQRRYSTHKAIDPTFFVKPNIFNTIQSR